VRGSIQPPLVSFVRVAVAIGIRAAKQQALGRTLIVGGIALLHHEVIRHPAQEGLYPGTCFAAVGHTTREPDAKVLGPVWVRRLVNEVDRKLMPEIVSTDQAVSIAFRYVDPLA
jgi:hypothetical protein